MQQDGDSFLSVQDHQLWSLIYSTMERYECLTIFRKRGPSFPLSQDCSIDFFVPRHHPRASQVKDYLEHEAKSLVFTERQTDEDWFPNTYVRVLYYSGLNIHLDRDVAEELAEKMCTSFLSSIKKELADKGEDDDDAD